MKTKGTINVWFETKQYGFIHEEKAGEILKHFLHANNIISGTPSTGAEVLFRSVVTRKGFLAVQVEVLSGDGGAQ
jgi:cold shock CspA family protein